MNHASGINRVILVTAVTTEATDMAMNILIIERIAGITDMARVYDRMAL